MSAVMRHMGNVQTSKEVGIFIVVILIVTLAVPAAMIAIGSEYLHACPIQNYIPIYLIVGGVVTIIIHGFHIYMKLDQMSVQEKQEAAESKETVEGEQSGLVKADTSTSTTVKCLVIIRIILALFQFAWYIAGNNWIYRLHSYGFTTNSTLPYAPTYCNPTLFWFSFWLQTATHILVWVFLIVVCCIPCIIRRCTNKHDKDSYTMTQ